MIVYWHLIDEIVVSVRRDVDAETLTEGKDLLLDRTAGFEQLSVSSEPPRPWFNLPRRGCSSRALPVTLTINGTAAASALEAYQPLIEDVPNMRWLLLQITAFHLSQWKNWQGSGLVSW
jgi:hypothetical protein